MGVCVVAGPVMADSPEEMADANPAQVSANVLEPVGYAATPLPAVLEPLGDAGSSPVALDPRVNPEDDRAKKAGMVTRDGNMKPGGKSKTKKISADDVIDTEDTRVDALQPALAAPESKPPEGGTEGRQDMFTVALANVYATHPQLKAQRETLEATDEGVSQAVSNLRPNVVAGYSVGRISTERDDSSRSTAKTASASQPIFVGGALSGIQGAKQRVKAGQAQLTAVEQQVLFDAVVAYSNVVNRLAVLQVNQNNVALLNKQFLATKSRFDVGQITRTDLAQAQSRLASAKANERLALGFLDVDRATFNRVIGFDAPDSLALPPEPDRLPQSLEEAKEQATAAEPTLLAAQELEKASKSDVGMFKGSILPTVNFVAATRDVQNNVSGTGNSNDSLTLNVTVPLYQSGAEWSRARQARDLAQRASYLTVDTKNAVVQNVTQAWQNYVTAKAVITSNEEAVRASKTAMKSIQQENKFGSRTILDVLNTQQDMVNTQVNLVNARVAERQAAYRLLATVGRLTADSLRLPVDINDPKQHYNKVKYKLIGF